MARSLGLRKVTGGLVAQVAPGSPADKAGVRAGDVITAVAGHPVESNTDLRDALGFLRVGDGVSIDLLRDGRHEQRHAVLADTLAHIPAQASARKPSGESARPRH